MNQKRIFSLMNQSSTYPHPVQTIQNIQTHISSVYLTGDYAYKIKKAVDFGFLDFSTLDKRNHFCHEELRLNQRLSPELYLDVVSLTKTDNETITINGQGPIVEYAVKMKQFPQSHIMSEQLRKDAVTLSHIETIVDTLVDFYQKQDTTEEITSYGTKDAVKKNIDENFDQTKDVINTTINHDTYHYIRNINNQFLDQVDDFFQYRCAHKYIKPCHGDLHSGNIVIHNDDISIFDCIEFNKRFQYIDVASDIGFLAMDLDYQNNPFLSSHLIQEYIQKMDDSHILHLLNFYKSYRAYVRGKVTGFQLNDPTIEEEKKNTIIKTAKKYFRLSSYYAGLCSIALNQTSPILFLVSGLTGTGKSTLSQKLSIDYHATIINTDMVRKELMGIDTYERHYDDPDTGLYAVEKRQKTYEKVIEKAETMIKNNQNVILDATFQHRRHRDAVKHLAENQHASLVMIGCSSPDTIVKQWLDERSKNKSISDGRWEIYQVQKQSFDPYQDDESVIHVDLSKDSFDQRFQSFTTIQQHVLAKVIS